MAIRYVRQKPLSVMQQVLRMKTLHPQFKEVVRRNKVVWAGTLRPGPRSNTYTIKVAYELGLTPRVSVLSPLLESRTDDERIPHLFNDGELCLYFPMYKEWAPDKLIALTIIPWASLWLYYYEIWHATGEWLGGGIEHGREAKLQ